MKFESKSQQVFSILIAMMMVTSLSTTVWAKAETSKGKLRSGTGIVKEIKQNVVLLEISQKKTLAIQLSEATQVYQDEVSNRQVFENDAVVEVSGQGKGDELLASKIIVLPKNEKMKFQRKKNSGTAYPEKMQTSQIKAQILTSEPLVLKNRAQQEIKVAFAKQHDIILRKQVASEMLQVLQKVKIEYRDKKDVLMAETIIIQPGLESPIGKNQ